MRVIRTIYVETGVARHPRTRAVLARLPRARRVSCERYGEIFNRTAQSFRLQKAAPALILAGKREGQVLPAPRGYGMGGRHNYYFAHLLNCPYDCRYCFLQGMYRSAHYVLFVDYEGFMTAIDQRLAAHGGERVDFFSGYDGDSLAFEGLSGFCAEFLPFFERRPRAWLELRTKSASAGVLEARSPLANCVVAFSFTPPAAHRRWERGVPAIERRLATLERLGRAGWKLGLRFDPLVWWPGCEAAYREHIGAVLSRLDGRWIHSVALGAFRLPAPFYRRLVALYPEEPLLAAPLARRGAMVSYPAGIEHRLIGVCRAEVLRHLAADRLFVCSVDGAPAGTPDRMSPRRGAALAGSADDRMALDVP